MTPPSLGTPAAASRARHQPEVYTNTSALATPALAKLPSSSVWTSYDLGSAGYAEASAIALASPTP